MLIKLGVDISRLKRPIRRTLKDIDEYYLLNWSQEAIITSTYEGNHRQDSLHYADLAIDIRSPMFTNRKDNIDFINDLKKILGNDYDVLLDTTKRHIHIEYDPK